MTILGGLLGKRSLENPQVPLTAANIAEFMGGTATDAGISITETSVLGLSAVWRATNLNATVSSSLPLKTYRKGTRKRVVVRLLENPHPDMTAKELWETAYVNLQLNGNAYLRKVRNQSGAIVWLYPIAPSCVKVGRVGGWTEAGMMSPKVYEVDWGHGKKEPLTDYEILHIPGLGYDGTVGASPVNIARNSHALGLAQQQFAGHLWSNGSLMSGILQSDQRLEQDQAEQIKARWREAVGGLSNSHDVVVLGSGASFQPVQMPNDDAQFLESRRFQIDEVARWFGIPPHMLFELSGSTSWGTGIEQQTISWVKFTLQPNWLSRVEQRITREITPAGVYAEYDLNGLMRGDSAARAAFYAATVGRPIFTVDEARGWENEEPIEGGGR